MRVKADGDPLTFDALLVESKSAREQAQGRKLPLVVYPHGGPHSNQGVDYYPGVTLLALQAYPVLIVNYRSARDSCHAFMNANTPMVF